MTQGRSDDGPNFEGHDERECGEHRTVGAHRAWCFDCSEWCYPGADGACKGCERPQLLARAVAAERGEDDQRAMLRDARAELAEVRRVETRHNELLAAELAAAQAATQALGEAVVELVEQKPSMGPGMLRDMVLRHCAALAAASGVAPDKPAPTECNDERCVLPGAHDLGEFGCLVDPGVAPDQPNGDKR